MGNLQIFNKHDAAQEIQDKVFPFGDNDKLFKIANKFHLEGKDIIEFHSIFRTMDKLGSGYITLENLFEFLNEELTSSLSPYIQRLFILTEKETSDRISFVEWLPAVSVYCLYPNERIISFVFSMIDDDHNKTISKKDMIKFLVQEHYGQKIFPYNYIKAIEILEVQRSDKITLDQFKRIQSKIPFLCYPAFRLQAALRAKILGNKFWDKTYQRIKEQESKDQKQIQADKIQDEIRKKQNLKIENKVNKFDELFGQKDISQNLVIPILKEYREPKRRGSDGKLCLDDGNLLDINEDLKKNKKRSTSFRYVKPQFVEKNKQQVQSEEDEDQNNNATPQNYISVYKKTFQIDQQYKLQSKLNSLNKKKKKKKKVNNKQFISTPKQFLENNIKHQQYKQ